MLRVFKRDQTAFKLSLLPALYKKTVGVQTQAVFISFLKLTVEVELFVWVGSF